MRRSWCSVLSRNSTRSTCRRCPSQGCSVSVNHSAVMPRPSCHHAPLVFAEVHGGRLEGALQDLDRGMRAGIAAHEHVERRVVAFRPGVDGDVRSEEHTSELQSLMRISYAVFCLKKQQTITYQPTHIYII